MSVLYDRVMARTSRDETTGCLICSYSLGSHGYAQVGTSSGPIPEDAVVDHTCHVRPCVEISHLRLLTNFENARRTFGRDWPLGECAQGHSNSRKHSGATTTPGGEADE